MYYDPTGHWRSDKESLDAFELWEYDDWSRGCIYSDEWDTLNHLFNMTGDKDILKQRNQREQLLNDIRTKYPNFGFVKAPKIDTDGLLVYDPNRPINGGTNPNENTVTVSNVFNYLSEKVSDAVTWTNNNVVKPITDWGKQQVDNFQVGFEALTDSKKRKEAFELIDKYGSTADKILSRMYVGTATVAGTATVVVVGAYAAPYIVTATSAASVSFYGAASSTALGSYLWYNPDVAVDVYSLGNDIYTGNWGNLPMDALAFAYSGANYGANYRGGKPSSNNVKLNEIQQNYRAVTANRNSSTGIGNSKPKTLYHYTNEQGMNGILESKQLNPSLKANNPKDARYGNGQYLSDIAPSTQTPSQLAKKFINVPNKYKYTNYVEIDVSDLNLVQGRDGVYVIPNETPLDLTGRIVSTGEVGK